MATCDEALHLYKAFDRHGTRVAPGRWVLNFPDPNLLSLGMVGPSEIAPGVSGMTVSGANWSLKASPNGKTRLFEGSAEAFQAVMCDVRVLNRGH